MSKEIPLFFKFEQPEPVLGLNEVPDTDISHLQGGVITDGLNVYFDPATNYLIFRENGISEYGPTQYKISLQSFLATTGVTLQAVLTNMLVDADPISVYAPFEAKPVGFDEAADKAYQENMNRYYAENPPPVKEAEFVHFEGLDWLINPAGHKKPISSYFADFRGSAKPTESDSSYPVAPE